MLMVSDMLEIARGSVREERIRAKSPDRFAPSLAAPSIVVWNVCQHCDLRCPHCYVSAGTRPSSSDLDTADAHRVIDDLADHGVKVIIFSGGEPLLRPDLFELLAHARSRGVAAQLSTSGIHVDAAIARKLAEHGIGYVGISIDGTREFNDEYRGLPGAFDRALAGVHHAHQAGLKTGVRMTLTRRNAPLLEGVLAAAEGAGADRFYVSHLVYAGRGLRLMGDDLRPTESRALLLRLFALAEARLDEGAAVRFVTGSNDSDGPLLLRWIEGRHGAEAHARVESLLRARGGNSAGEKLLAIDPRGRVHPDQFWQGMTLGQVPAQSIAEILAHPMRDELRTRESRLVGRCGGCRFKGMCRGSHRERALAASGQLWAEDPACVMTDDEVTYPGPASGGSREIRTEGGPSWSAA